MYKITTTHEEIIRDQWEDFVRVHPNGNIFHTPQIVELYNASPKVESLVLGCLNESQQLVGLLVAVIQREYRGLLGKLTERAVVFGGPLVMGNNQHVASLILEEFNRLCSSRVVYSQFRNLWDIIEYTDAFQKQGYFFEEHLDILFDLNLGKDILWNALHPTRRKQINRGLRRGVQTKIVNLLEPEELSICYSILRRVYQEARLPFPSIAHFINSVFFLGRMGYFKAALAMYKNEIIGFRFFLAYKGLLYDWYAGSRSEHYDKYPNDVLPWEILKWGIEEGYDTFDFGGAGKPNFPYKVRDYKLKFGGTLVNYGRFEKVHKPVLMAIAKLGFRVWKRFRVF